MLYDKDIREPLFDFLEEAYGKVRIIEEKQVGRSRADIVMVLPSSVAGIEIKSDADTYARLSRQVRDYDRYFDYNFVAVGSTHAMHVGERVPQWWGIISAERIEGRMDFYVVRQPQKNPGMSWEKKLEILWRPELSHIQELNGMAKYARKSKAFVIGKILEAVPPEILGPQVSQELFERDYTEIARQIAAFRKEKSAKKTGGISKGRTRKRRPGR